MSILNSRVQTLTLVQTLAQLGFHFHFPSTKAFQDILPRKGNWYLSIYFQGNFFYFWPTKCSKKFWQILKRETQFWNKYHYQTQWYRRVQNTMVRTNTTWKSKRYQQNTDQQSRYKTQKIQHEMVNLSLN